MARSSWTYLKGEKRVGEYEELTIRSIGHWSILDSDEWPEALKLGYHLYSETGVGMVEQTKLHIKDYYRYRDPFKLTYRSYTLQQDLEEKKLDSIIEGAKARDSFIQSPVLETITAKYIPGMRHFFWGSGMLEIYGSAYTPSGTVMNSLLFQIFDNMRHAQRMVELAWELNHAKGTVVDSHDAWLLWPALQPLRKYIEYSLTGFDWGENFVLMNFVLNPIFQPLHNAIMVEIPESQGDWAIPQFWLKLAVDTKRHLTYGEEFVKTSILEDERNKAIIQEWIDRWYPLAIEAIDGLKPIIDEANKHGFARSYADIQQETITNYCEKLKIYGLQAP